MERLVPVLAGRHFNTFDIDGLSCKLYYKFTSALFIASFFLGASRQYFGEAILCTSNGVETSFANQYCWSNSTYTVEGGAFANDNHKEREYQYYYQWVNCVLLIYALSFYFPHYVWKCHMKSKIVALNVKDATLKIDECHIVLELLKSSYLKSTAAYYKYIAVEILNFCVLVINFVLLNSFFGKKFTSYGIDVMRSSSSKDVADKFFPLITKCSITLRGNSGDETVAKLVCLLPLNVLYAKVFLAVWIWFVFLAVCSSLVLVFRIATLLSKRVRLILSPQYIDDSIHIWWLFQMAKSNISGQNLFYILKRYNDKKDDGKFFIEK